MITGDHTITARAIADELGLGAGVITGTELSHLDDATVIARLPELHVFGRVAPEDKVRLARLMQEAGERRGHDRRRRQRRRRPQAGRHRCCHGKGSEVTKQAGRSS
jgi:P-type Ca2+ transporter type 2C